MFEVLLRLWYSFFAFFFDFFAVFSSRGIFSFELLLSKWFPSRSLHLFRYQFDIYRFLVTILFLFGTASKLVLLNESEEFFIWVSNRPDLFIKSATHALDESSPEAVKFPFLNIVVDVLPLVDGLHGVQDGSLCDFPLFGFLEGEKIEQFLN